MRRWAWCLWRLGGAVDRAGEAIRGVALAMIVCGPIFLVIDFRSGLPWWWLAGEGPFISLLGGIILLLAAKVRQGRW